MKTISRTEKYNAEPGKIFNYPDDPCVTGTHDATTIEMKKAYIIGGKEIPAGKYAFFTIPGKKEWTVIINKNCKQHLATEYDEKEDVVRIKIKPTKNAQFY